MLKELGNTNCIANIDKLAKNFLNNREIIYEKNGDMIRKTYSRSCLQRSNSGLLLWKFVCNSALRLLCKDDVHLHDCVDDHLMLVSDTERHKLWYKTKTTSTKVIEWNEAVKVTFGSEKSQMLPILHKSRGKKDFVESNE